MNSNDPIRHSGSNSFGRRRSGDHQPHSRPWPCSYGPRPGLTSWVGSGPFIVVAMRLRCVLRRSRRTRVNAERTGRGQEYAQVGHDIAAVMSSNPQSSTVRNVRMDGSRSSILAGGSACPLPPGLTVWGRGFFHAQPRQECGYDALCSHSSSTPTTPAGPILRR